MLFFFALKVNFLPRIFFKNFLRDKLYNFFVKIFKIVI